MSSCDNPPFIYQCCSTFPNNFPRSWFTCTIYIFMADGEPKNSSYDGNVLSHAKMRKKFISPSKAIKLNSPSSASLPPYDENKL